MDIVVIDRCTKGNGWIGKKKGVGWARKVILDEIALKHDETELMVSLDADTGFNEDYLEQVLDTMNHNAEASALSIPYYHPLSNKELVDRNMLRYECYMRYYLINLLRIGNPYAFSALGSAMAFPAWAYKRVGGITPLQGGEDFYLMQKFCKTGHIVLDTKGIVFPQGRISHRVPFGTGPAIASTLALQKEKYPFYSLAGFDEVAKTYSMLPALYANDIETPMTKFMQQQLKSIDIWGPLRKNFKTLEKFTNACMERLDGLRILQYLKGFPTADSNLEALLDHYDIPHERINFETNTVEDLNHVRNNLFALESRLRKERTT